MRTAILALTLFFTVTPGFAADREEVLQPSVRFSVQFGGKHPALRAPNLEAQLNYARNSLLGARSASPALVRWQVDSEGTALSLSGMPMYARSWKASATEDASADRSGRITRGVATGATLTVIGVGVVLAAVNGFMQALGDGMGEAMVDSMTTGSEDGSGNGGDTGQVCVGTVCTPGGGG